MLSQEEGRGDRKSEGQIRPAGAMVGDRRRSGPSLRSSPSLQDPQLSLWSPQDPFLHSRSAGSTPHLRGNMSGSPGPLGHLWGTDHLLQVPNPTSAMATSTRWPSSGARCLCLRYEEWVSATQSKPFSTTELAASCSIRRLLWDQDPKSLLGADKLIDLVLQGDKERLVK